MVRKRKPMENAVVGNDFEDWRPCYTHKGGDLCSKLIYAVLTKYNPAMPNDKYNDLQRVDYEKKVLPSVGFNETEVDFIFNIASSTNPSVRKKLIKNAIRHLTTERKILNKSDGGIVACPIFTLLNYSPSDPVNTLVARLNYDLLELALNFKDNNRVYCIESFNDIRLLNSDYAIKIYSYCQRYEKIRSSDYYEKSISVADLKNYLGVSAGYTTQAFNIRILDKYTKEISEKTSVNITYKKKMYGRKITNYIFCVKPKISEKPRKHYEAGFACVNGIDSSLINPDNIETVAYLTKKGINKKQLIEVIKKGTSYLKYVTEKIDSQYAKLTSNDMAYYDNEKRCYCSFIDNRPIMYGALFWGAVKGWLNYDKWAQEHEEDVKRDQARLIELSNIKMHEAEEVAKERERKETREDFKNAIPSYKNLSDEQLDRIIDTAEAMNKLNREAEEAQRNEKAIDIAARKELETGNTKYMDQLVIDSIVKVNYDTDKLLTSPFAGFYKLEQQRLGYKDFTNFVDDIRKGIISGK